MFEYWSDDFSASLRRVIDPPAPVLVDLSIAITPQGPFRRDAVSMRIKRAGLDCTSTVPGLLYAWAQCIDGSWIGLVGFAIPAANRQGRIETRQWTVARALSRRGDPSPQRSWQPG
ncbi:hypothetical protein NONI108955_34275 [Nocardia ninae]|uniref:Uncharacterized protein n=1 Tax=Nocardia ninae NBRC 108245 TaxID=1210091 RepID=A0A511MRX0_9NOCA|nr:hypothetical protein [Nocardia ninae]GEM43353.1 hypothetical protein NN4_78720 [Nocardia ninae NBRC 108245]